MAFVQITQLKKHLETIKKPDKNSVWRESLDLQKAFDTVNYKILHDKLNHYGVICKNDDCFRSFVTGGKQNLSTDGFFFQAKFVRRSALT